MQYVLNDYSKFLAVNRALSYLFANCTVSFHLPQQIDNAGYSLVRNKNFGSRRVEWSDINISANYGFLAKYGNYVSLMQNILLKKIVHK